MSGLYNCYEMVFLMLEKYRKYKINSKKLTKEEFKEKIKNGYIKIKTVSNSGDKVMVFLAKENSEWTRKSEQFRKVLDKLGDEKQQVIIISYKSRLHLLFKNNAQEYPNLELINYSIDHFKNELPLGPHCSKHTILPDQEVRELFLETLSLKSCYELPRILIDDPQIIWIGAKINDVIKIETKSKITGKYISYRIVSPNPASSRVSKSEGDEMEEKIDPDFEPEQEDEVEEEINPDFEPDDEEEPESETETPEPKKQKNKTKSDK